MLLGIIALAPVLQAAKPVAVLRTPPPYQISNKINAVGYALDADQWLQFLVIFTLGPVGYPSFPGASRSENGAVLFFESDMPQSSYVLMLKLESGNKLASHIEEAGLVSREIGGWTVFAPDALGLNYVQEANFQDILASVRKERRYDFELEMTFSPGQLNNLHAMTLENSASQPQEQATWDAVFDLASGLESATLGATLGDKTFTYGLELEARPDSPEGKLFSMPVGGDVPVAGYISAESSAGMLFRVDPKAVKAYFDTAAARIEPALEPDAQVSFTEFKSEWDMLVEGWDGTGAYATDFGPDGQYYLALYGGTWTEDPFEAVLNDLFDETIPAMLSGLPITEMAQSMNEAAAESKQGDGSSAELSSAMGNLTAGQSLESLSEYTPPQRALVNGWMILSNMPSVLDEASAAVESKTPLENPLSSRLTLEPGVALRAYFDLKAMMLDTMRSFDTTQSPSLSLSLKELEAQDLPPASYHIDMSDNHMSLQFDVPTKTLRELMGVVNELGMRHSEQKR